MFQHLFKIGFENPPSWNRPLKRTENPSRKSVPKIRPQNPPPKSVPKIRPENPPSGRKVSLTVLLDHECTLCSVFLFLAAAKMLLE